MFFFSLFVFCWLCFSLGRVVCCDLEEDVFFVLGAWCFSSATTSSLWSSAEARELVKYVFDFFVFSRCVLKPNQSLVLKNHNPNVGLWFFFLELFEMLSMYCILISSYIYNVYYTPFILQTCRSNSWRFFTAFIRDPRWFPHHKLSWWFFCKGQPTKQKWFLNNWAWWISILHRSILWYNDSILLISFRFNV